MNNSANIKTWLVMMVLVLGIFCTIAVGDIIYVDADTVPEEQWNKTFGSSDYESAASVQQTSDGGYIMAGRTVLFWGRTHGFVACLVIISLPLFISTYVSKV